MLFAIQYSINFPNHHFKLFELFPDKLCGGVISRTIFSTGNRLFIQIQTSYPLFSIFAHYIGLYAEKIFIS